MKKLLTIFVLLGILTNLNLVIADGVYNTSSGLVYTNMAYLKTTFVSQSPTSGDPGNYVDLLFKIENWGTENAENVTFELLPKYPFSLNPGTSAIQELGTVKALQRGENAFLLRYKVKIDKDAVNGDNEIGTRFSYSNGLSYSNQTFNVLISNPRTDFDVIAQDSTTLAIANIGANTAYSVIVKIPEQKNFIVSGASANIIGNLDAGDYTLATFQISTISASNTSRRMSVGGNFTNISASEGRNLIVEISYTDTLGIRRTVQKEVSFDFVSGTTTSTFQRGQSSVSFLGNNGLTYMIIGVVGIVAIITIFKLRKRKKK